MGSVFHIKPIGKFAGINPCEAQYLSKFCGNKLLRMTEKLAIASCKTFYLSGTVFGYTIFENVEGR